MSRGDFGGGYQGGYDYESNNQRNASRNGDSEYLRLSNSVSNKVQQLTRKIANIQKLVNQIGTTQDVPENFEVLQGEQKDANLLAKETSSLMHQLGNLQAATPGEAKQRKIQQDKFHDNFTNALNNLQKVQRLAAEKERASLQRARAKSMEFQGGYQNGLEDTSRMNAGAPPLQIQTEAELSLDMIRDREDAIRQLESDIVNVNEIFKDLAIMVHEQGDVIDSIEANVDSTVVHVEAGNVQLEKARDYQRKSRKKMCCILVICLLAATILGIIIWVSTK